MQRLYSSSLRVLRQLIDERELTSTRKCHEGCVAMEILSEKALGIP
jgi:hypothetical protein